MNVHTLGAVAGLCVAAAVLALVYAGARANAPLSSSWWLAAACLATASAVLRVIQLVVYGN